jgi:hypothetical protein
MRLSVVLSKKGRVLVRPLTHGNPTFSIAQVSGSGYNLTMLSSYACIPTSLLDLLAIAIEDVTKISQRPHRIVRQPRIILTGTEQGLPQAWSREI